MTLPTWITLSRLLAVPILLFGLLPRGESLPSAEWRWLCVGIFLLAAGTDWLDGYLARRLDQVTDLGKFLDPLVDKLLILAPLLALIELRLVPAWSVFLILFRELAIAGWRVSQPQISGANLWGKLKTILQILAVALLIAPLPTNWRLLVQVIYGSAITLTLISGAIYLTGKPTKASPETVNQAEIE